MLIPDAQLELAVELALSAPGLVVPFTEYRYYSWPDSCHIVEGHPVEGFRPEMVMADGTSIGAAGVTSEETMKSVVQWDESFSGWGYDDNAMFRAFEVCAANPRWVEGPGHHLWHPPGMATPVAEEIAATDSNAARWLRYKNEEDPEAVRSLTTGQA